MAYHYHSSEELAAYYRTDEWQHLRKQVHQRNKNCERCAKANIANPGCDVHHKEYPEILGTESIETLIHLCRECHQFVHYRSAYDPTNPSSPCELRHKKMLQEWETSRIEREKARAEQDRIFKAETDALMAEIGL